MSTESNISPWNRQQAQLEASWDNDEEAQLAELFRRQMERRAQLQALAPPPIIQVTAVPAEETAAQKAAAEVKPLSEYSYGLRRNKWLILLAALIGASCAFFLSSRQHPVYQATATVEIEGKNESFLNFKEVDPMAPILSQEAMLQTQLELINSNSVLERVATKVPLEDNSGELWMRMKALWNKVHPTSSNMFPPDVSSSSMDALEQLRERVHIKGSAPATLVRITAEGGTPQHASQLANAVVGEFVGFNSEMQARAGEQTREWLNKQLEEAKQKLTVAEQELQRYSRESGLLFTGEHQSAAQEKLKQLQEEMSRAQGDRFLKEAQFDSASNAQADAIPAVLDNAVLGDYQVKLTELRRQLAEVSSALTPTHYKVQRIREQIAEMQSAFEMKRSDIVKRLAIERDAARRREATLSTAYSAQARLVSDQAEKEIRYNVLKREADSQRSLYETLLEHAKATDVATARNSATVRVVDIARNPHKPVRPRVAINTAIGLLTGLFGAFAFVVVRVARNETVRKPGQFTDVLKATEMAVLPESKALAKAVRVKGNLKNGTDPLLHPGISDPLRMALGSLVSSTTNGTWRSLMITSPGSGEGKTAITVALAALLAQLGKRVLVVDTNGRNPRIHELFGVSNEEGLSALLSRADEFETEELVKFALSTDTPELHVLPAGPRLDEVGEFALADRMQWLLEGLQEHFDIILVDTPPVLSMATARILSRMVGASLLVYRFDQTGQDAVVAAANLLTRSNSRFLGTILNDWDPEKPHFAYSSPYVPREAGRRS
ncbi:MAG: polysaccharide biosynthesis tyrosine autokinase [Bryobacteraceae bacterium]